MDKARKLKVSVKIAWVIAALLALLALSGATSILVMEHSASALLPEDTAYSETEGQWFPDIDWQYWQNINPDIIGWVSVTDTNIDYPIVQAHESDPTYYLYHDVYNNWNYCGCPYLDYRCEPDGLNSYNATIFGHHLRSNTMFSMFSNYSDANFAREHQKILIQTPEWKKIVEVRYVDVVDANVYENQLEFEDVLAFQNWYKTRLEQADDVLDGAMVDQIYTFVTCSYSRFGNERTLVAASAPTGNTQD